jgi:Flp pilus assembly pilin Flp
MMTDLIKRFRDNEDGSAAIELVLVTPIITWALLSTIVYFDAFRAETRSARAGLTIADMFSREASAPVAIGAGYVDAAQALLGTLVEFDPAPALRVTSYAWDAAANRYVLRWSESRGMGQALTDVDLALMTDRLPLLADGATSLLVETSAAYRAPFSLGIAPFTNNTLGPVEMTTFTVISPRFVLAICFDPTPLIPTNGDEIC